MLLTVEYNSKGVVELFMDEGGRKVLIEALQQLSVDNTTIDHDHLMTAAWAGCELTEEIQNTSNELINKLTVFLVREGKP